MQSILCQGTDKTSESCLQNQIFMPFPQKLWQCHKNAVLLNALAQKIAVYTDSAFYVRHIIAEKGNYLAVSVKSDRFCNNIFGWNYINFGYILENGF